ncbi:3-hydroxyacyl-CoA dehydrogenase NAD-binding domain-containing protein [Amorphoplanes digitatis]|uniref:3-hydroxyacyl-CoA dehydrogenase/enoyl-CoA hydratase/3-hydroxybutyryl-CoA epimerase n=1 Tax=Actinoplanes digitatis TaxID=1868 RepID=A0A7W7MQ64_9ACTN|nr:3-hydroxyacyl-CoA dehydrogenase NAD-binding domain-containing protein [Actinoplanes digitatis]MBB4762094.1 3-hydroxyacyl-CoA dehydrogenase/enoyl-CoA hydratase/3-hydroxybutyryl-CoA epimerase [Actinoplanes digitatis]GID97065.1 3-hydroxyacyl-CoA dehydrogenase [Actinoplanes digitatis]
MTATIAYHRDPDGVVTLTLDDPGQSANTMNRAYAASMTAVVDRLVAEKDAVTGVIVTSAKQTFFAGGDLPEMIKVTSADAPAVTALLDTVKGDLRRLETLGRPVVAAINGSALGGGLEIALACHHRIALDAGGSRLGFPEVTLGLLPGAGGVTRTVRMMGLAKALTTVLLTGRQFRPADALAAGLVDAVVATPEELIAGARAWIAAHPDAAQPWDTPGYRMPGGTPTSPSLAAQLPAFPANLRKQLKGNRMPAPEAILAAAVEGAQVDVDTALTVETRHLVTLLTGQVAKNMIGAFFFDLKTVNGGAGRPAVEVAPTTRVAVLGAGMMGAGIAYACARAGLDVVLKDVTEEAAARGRAHAEKLVGRLPAEKAAAILARITATADVAALAGCDAVIEAVFEDPELKRKVFAEVEPVLAEGALLASNTSTLPITGLAAGVARPADFIGMHFFSPVDKMPLLEIVVGEQTGDAALARAFDLGRRLGKTPIVVNDGRGFFTSRVIGRFLDEAIGMLAEGIPAPSIEQAALQAGYPTGPLALADEVSLTLMRRIRRQFEAAQGADFAAMPSHGVVDLLDGLGRAGRAAGQGFYDYENGRRGRLWSGLAPMATAEGRAVPLADLQERLLFAESLDALRCLDEGVLRSETDGDIGSLLGIGFPAWTGGVLRYVRQYPGGPAGFAARASELAKLYGDRFTPPARLPGSE